MCPKDIIGAGEMQKKKNTLESPPVIHKTLCVAAEIEPGTSRMCDKWKLSRDGAYSPDLHKVFWIQPTIQTLSISLKGYNILTSRIAQARGTKSNSWRKSEGKPRYIMFLLRAWACWVQLRNPQREEQPVPPRPVSLCLVCADHYHGPLLFSALLSSFLPFHTPLSPELTPTMSFPLETGRGVNLEILMPGTGFSKLQDKRKGFSSSSKEGSWLVFA